MASENKLLLEIVTPHGLVFSGNVDEVTATGTDGEFGVLPGHAHLATILEIGILICRVGSEKRFFFINQGYAEVGPDKVFILADSAEASEDIDVERAKAAMKRTEERLAKSEQYDFQRAASAIQRSTTRIQITKMKLPK
jgi:F-type H+-transporting ATPase subunit epsilon